MHSTELENIPAIFFYFDDSPVPPSVFLIPWEGRELMWVPGDIITRCESR